MPQIVEAHLANAGELQRLLEPPYKIRVILNRACVRIGEHEIRVPLET
jgi:hypothetical protein